MLGFENVPKGKRLKYFKDYYLISTVILIICILMVVSIIRTTFFREREDINIMIAAASSDYTYEHGDIIIEAIKNNFDVDFNGNGNEFIVINDAILSGNKEDYKTAEQDMAIGMKFNAIMEASRCIIQIVDENMYNYLLEENMIETYENLEKYGLKGEGYIKIPLSQTKLDPKMMDPLYLTVRPEASSRLKEEIYKNHIELVKQIIE